MSVCTISSTSSSFRLPLFLAPAFAEAAREFRRSSSRSFSTSPLSLSRRTTGPNKERGVSAIRGKNPKPKSRVYQYPLPVPVIDPERRALFKTREDHGLWGFFNKKRESMIAPAAESSHGREWTIAELNGKSFHDLHKLYWTCILEMNQISTRAAEMQRMRAGFGISESKRRKKMVRSPTSVLFHIDSPDEIPLSLADMIARTA